MTVVHQLPLSVEFFRQECWSGLPFPIQGIVLTQELNPSFLYWQADSLPLCHLGSPISSAAVFSINTLLILWDQWFILCALWPTHAFHLLFQVALWTPTILHFNKEKRARKEYGVPFFLWRHVPEISKHWSEFSARTLPSCKWNQKLIFFWVAMFFFPLPKQDFFCPRF